MSRRLFYCDHYAIPLPAGHKFPMSKYRLVRDLLDSDGFYRFECAPMADPAVAEATAARAPRRSTRRTGRRRNSATPGPVCMPR